MKKFLSFIFIIYIFGAMNLMAATWYVSTTGSNTTGNGTLSNPWQTIKFAVENNVSVLNGDTILIAAGTYTEIGTYGTLINITKSLTIQGAGISSTIINGSGQYFNVFKIEEFVNNVTIKDLKIHGGYYSINVDGDMNNLSIINVNCDNYLYYGIELYSLAMGINTNALVSECIFTPSTEPSNDKIAIDIHPKRMQNGLVITN